MFHLLVLVSLLICLLPAGIIGVGVMLIQLARLRNVHCCRVYFSVPGPFQSVQRAELWGVILALQSSGAVHLGVDNVGVVRHVCRSLDGRCCSVPFELVKDGDLLVLIERMLHLRGLDTVRISKSRVMLMRLWLFMVRFVRMTGLVTMLLMRLLNLDVGELVLLSLMLVVTCLGSMVAGILLCLIFIDFLLPFLGLWSIMMETMGLPPILRCGLPVLSPEASAGSGGSGPGILARAAWNMGFRLD